MVHFDNIKFVLSNGICSKNYMQPSTEYVNIGNDTLIKKRDTYPVDIKPGGVLGDYVPFYFCGHSPMLLNIKQGGEYPCSHRKTLFFYV